MRKQFLLVFVVLLTGTMILAQETPISTNNQRSLLYDAFGYSSGLGPESYGEFSWSYPLNNTTQVQAGLIHSRSNAIETINARLLIKHYVSKKTYLFGGVENVYEANMTTGGRFVRSTNVMLGVGHEVNARTKIEFGYHRQTGTPAVQGQSFTIQQPQTLSLRARF